MEPYFLFSTSVRQRSAFAKLRISDHKLAIETGRHESPRTPPNERFCSTCTSTPVIDDELHAVMHCTEYAQVRKTSFSALDQFATFSSLSESQKFNCGKDFDVFTAIRPLFESIIHNNSSTRCFHAFFFFPCFFRSVTHVFV